MADEKRPLPARPDPTLPAKVAAVVVNEIVEFVKTHDQPETGGRVPAQFVLAWMEVVLRALAGDVPSVVKSFQLATSLAARERLTWLLVAHGWCAECATGRRDQDGLHPCAIVVEGTGQICTCTGCGPL